MSKHSTIEIYKENMKFSAGHFTIWSATEREHLHGHNYTVYCAFDTLIESNGMSFDYRFYKDKLYKLCRELNQTVLLPSESPYLIIEEDDTYIFAKFNSEKIPFLKRDVKLLPLANITVEELSFWFLDRLTQNQTELESHKIQKINIKVFSGPGQSGSALWER